MSEKGMNLITLGTTLEDEYKLMRGLKEDTYDEDLETENRPKQQEGQRVVRQIKPIKLTAEREAKMLSSYEEVCVNDFLDDYHMSDEEKEKRSELYKVFKKMRVCKTKYRRIDEYVRAYRIVLECIQAVSNQNKIYCQDDFKSKVLKGKIKVVGLKLPKYIGKDKRYINWDIISEYILDPEMDETELRQKGGDVFEVYDSDENDERLSKLFTEEELEKIFSISEDKHIEKYGFDPDIDDANDVNVCLPVKRKHFKLIHSTCPVVVDKLKDSLKSAKMRKEIDSYNFDIAEMQYNDIEEIRQQDEKRGFKSKFTPPVFKGDASKKKDIDKFLYEYDEYERTKVKINVNGTWMTQEEIDDQKLKEELDRAGWNVRNLYKYRSDEKKIKKQFKIDNKKEKKLRERLLAISERNAKREELLNGGPISDKKKKKSKKIKKLDEKNSKRLDKELIERTGMDLSDYERELFGYIDE